MKTTVPISVLIPVKNEERNLERCLLAVAWAAEIWVVDSASTDATVAIAKANGAHVVQFQFSGTWPKKKNWALENLPFAHEWVLIVDADEVLHPSFADEVRKIVSAENSSIAGYWINRRFMFMGQWLRHSYYPNWNLRFFRHRLGRYEKLTAIDTNSGDNEVHEHVVVEGATARMESEMDHYAFPSIEVFVEKHNRYSNWEACVANEPRLRSSAAAIQSPRVGLRRRLKHLSHRLPFRPFLRFCYIYIWQMGFLDGKPGYYFARLHGLYELLCIAKTHELRLRREAAAKTSVILQK